jgi:hypothetical protein
MIVYKIATQFSPKPGPRYRRDDPETSGEAFREDVLLPLFDEAVRRNEKILIDLDGGYGYGSSFLDEAFGGLARARGTRAVLERIDFKSEEEFYLRDDIVKLVKKNEARVA